MTPNPFHGWEHQTHTHIQSLRQKETISFGALKHPQSPRNQHAPLMPFPPSLPLQAKNPWPEEAPASRPELSACVTLYLCFQIRHALSLRHSNYHKPNCNPNP